MNNAESNMPDTIHTQDVIEIRILISAMADNRAMIAETKTGPRLNTL